MLCEPGLLFGVGLSGVTGYVQRFFSAFPVARANYFGFLTFPYYTPVIEQQWL